MRLVEIARGVRDVGERGARGMELLDGSQTHQRGETLGRRAHDAVESALERALAQPDVADKIFDACGRRSALDPGNCGGDERVG